MIHCVCRLVPLHTMAILIQAADLSLQQPQCLPPLTWIPTPDSRIEAIRCKCCSSLLLLCLVDAMHRIPLLCGMPQQHWFCDQPKLLECCVHVAPTAPCKAALLCCAASMHCNLLLFSVTKQDDHFYHSKLVKCCVHVAPLLLLARLLCRAVSLHCVLLFSVPSSMCFFSKPMCSDHVCM